MASTSQSIARFTDKEVSLASPDNSAELEKALRVERGRLRESFEELKHSLREQVDVRTHVREHPAIAAAAALAVGAALGVISARWSGSSRARKDDDHDYEDDDDGGRERFGRTSSAVGQFALMALDLAGRRVVEVAESSLRDAWARRKRHR